MKDSRLLLSWAMMFFATAMLTTGSVSVLAWVIGVLCAGVGIHQCSKEKSD